MFEGCSSSKMVTMITFIPNLQINRSLPPHYRSLHPSFSPTFSTLLSFPFLSFTLYYFRNNSYVRIDLLCSVNTTLLVTIPVTGYQLLIQKQKYSVRPFFNKKDYYCGRGGGGGGWPY